jgi:6-phosphogluconate dehydrogenase
VCGTHLHGLYDSYRSEDLSANLIQAQRDYFGAHTYERKDREGVINDDKFLSKAVPPFYLIS